MLGYLMSRLAEYRGLLDPLARLKLSGDRLTSPADLIWRISAPHRLLHIASRLRHDLHVSIRSYKS
jgi:hypothetical protein